MIPADRALQLLRAGNQRFVASLRDGTATPEPRTLPSTHAPKAIVLGCSDARVSPEFIFDLPLGDLFVIRVAGNVATSTQIASIEFAAQQFGSRLVLVLGHQGCAAVLASVLATLSATEGLNTPAEETSPHLLDVVECVRPSITPLLATDLRQDTNALAEQAIRNHIHGTVRQLHEESPILADLADRDGLAILGAKYSLDTGEVEFLDR